jgi:hypothetical protein
MRLTLWRKKQGQATGGHWESEPCLDHAKVSIFRADGRLLALYVDRCSVTTETRAGVLVCYGYLPMLHVSVAGVRVQAQCCHACLDRPSLLESRLLRLTKSLFNLMLYGRGGGDSHIVDRSDIAGGNMRSIADKRRQLRLLD